MSCLVIDEDPKTIRLIQHVGYNFFDNNINVALEDIDKAIDSVLTCKPELVMFNLDSTKIPISDFFLELRQCLTHLPKFVALSAFKVKAFEAYKYNCSDFILKPLSDLYLKKSFHKLKKC